DIINKKVDKFFGGTGFLLELCRDLNYLVEVNDDVNPIETLKGLIETHFNYNATTLDYYWNGSETKTYDNTTPIYENYLKETVDKIVFKQGEFNKIKVRIILNYYHEIIKGFANQEHIRPLIGRMFKKLNMLEKLVEVETEQNATPETNNLTVISLRDVNTEMKKILPLIICKQLYDEKKSDEDTTKSLHIIIDEAHNILSSSSQRESETWKDYRLETFEEIIKEGRKFGTFLTIASQRPYDISSTIISQLHNYFIHRLINENDIQAVSKTVAYLDKLSFQTIPILSVGSCFVAGLASDLPVKVDIDLLDKKDQPSSETINLENAWGI
ncbi:ATP-binding protein, partial [Candidatus Nomurabacteria bacterium]|nr:ATP-binding protein [Candidatus Nomurabacteria bacterium]